MSSSPAWAGLHSQSLSQTHTHTPQNKQTIKKKVKKENKEERNNTFNNVNTSPCCRLFSHFVVCVCVLLGVELTALHMLGKYLPLSLQPEFINCISSVKSKAIHNLPTFFFFFFCGSGV
jgi:hypothetical protein